MHIEDGFQQKYLPVLVLCCDGLIIFELGECNE